MASVYPPQLPQGAPVVPVFQNQGQPSAIRDPLFEALVKYITQGPGPSSVTANDVQIIIDSQTSHPEGRAYLESLVAPTPVLQPRIWKNSLDVTGYFSTSLSSWTIDLQGSGTGIPWGIKFRAGGLGVYVLQIEEIKDEKFYWDDFSGVKTVYPQVTVDGGRVVVDIFEGEVKTPETPPIAQISFPAKSLRLSPRSYGQGTLSIAQ